METMIVENLKSSRSGRTVANQYNINFKGMAIFQSYSTVIAAVKNQILYVDENYYSRTTSKYLNAWIRDHAYKYEKIEKISNSKLLKLLKIA